MNELQTAVTGRPMVENIYLNEKGEWLFYPHPDFPIVKTRAEILGEAPVKNDTAPVTISKN